MTDRELLELAAKAAGIYYKHDNKDWKHEDHCAFRSYDDLCTCGGRWNPLDDDGDALRLAVKLKMDFVWDCDRIEIYYGIEKDYVVEDFYELRFLADAEMVATRQAIVRAAAEIGRAMK